MFATLPLTEGTHFFSRSEYFYNVNRVRILFVGILFDAASLSSFGVRNMAIRVLGSIRKA